MLRRKKYGTRGRHKPDYLIIATTCLLVLFGLVMLASASSHIAQEKFDDSYYYLKHQLTLGLSIGIVGFFLGFWIPYRFYEKIAFFLLLGSIVLLALIFTPLGVEAKGATRWLTIGPITFQPSELLKITFIMYLAAWLGKKGERAERFWSGFFPFLVVCGIVSGLLLAQHSTSIVGILILTALLVYFASGARFRYIAGFAGVGALALALVIYFTPYRFERVMNYLKQDTVDVRAGGFHLEQARLAIGAGEVTGVGYGQSTSKLRSLPESIGDSIFAVIAEELGFIGVTALLTLFMFLVLRLFILARKSPDRFAKLLLIGFGSIIAVQVFVNVGAISGLIPLTGTPLPFVSYGGTALAVFMTMMGISGNISKYTA